MWNFLAPPAYKQELPAEKIDSAYKSYRWQVFLGIFIEHRAFYECGCLCFVQVFNGKRVRS